jgi:hypothetical protein
MSASPIVARSVGEPGFVAFAKALERRGVLSPEELRAWLGLHGAVLRARALPLDAGSGIAAELLDRLEEELK